MLCLDAGMLGQPESPRWLVQKDRTSEAEQSARKLWGTEGAAQLGDTKSGGSLSSACLLLCSLPHNSTACIQASRFVVLWSDPLLLILCFSLPHKGTACIQARRSVVLLSDPIAVDGMLEL